MATPSRVVRLRVLLLCCALVFTAGVARAATPPKIKGRPQIAGTAQQGTPLTASATWTGDPPPTAEWVWMGCDVGGKRCADIPGATASTYVPAAGDVGRALRVRLTLVAGVRFARQRSDPTAPVLPAPAPVVTPAPTPAPAIVLPPAAPAPQPAPGPEPPRPLRPFPVIRVKGVLTAGGARITLLRVSGPRGARIAVRCRGRSCPAAALTRRAPARLRAFERRLDAGTRLELTVSQPQTIVKWTRLVIRRDRPPQRRDGCLLPDTKRHVRCPGD